MSLNLTATLILIYRWGVPLRSQFVAKKLTWAVDRSVTGDWLIVNSYFFFIYGVVLITLSIPLRSNVQPVHGPVFL